MKPIPHYVKEERMFIETFSRFEFQSIDDLIEIGKFIFNLFQIYSQIYSAK